MMRKLLCLLNAFLLLNFCSCTEVECPLDSVVVMTCGMYNAETNEKMSVSQTLTITPAGKDTTLLNMAQDIQDFVLPLKIGETCDTMLFHFSDSWENKVTDTLCIYHDNMPHFESVECPAAVFHKLSAVEWRNDASSKTSVFIDSVAIVRELVDYNDIENLQIYLRNAH